MQMALVANLTLVTLSLVMGMRLLVQYRSRPKSHTLWYAVGLLLTALAAFPEVYRGMTDSLPTFLWWLYWVAASALVGFLAVGTAYLVSPGFGRAILVFAAVLTAVLAVLTVATAGPAPAVLTDSTFAKAPNGYIKAPLLIQNIAGALIIFGGAFWSFLRTRAWFAVFIGLGTLVFSAGGASAGLLKVSELFYFTQTAGIVLLYLGISRSRGPRRPEAPARPGEATEQADKLAAK